MKRIVIFFMVLFAFTQSVFAAFPDVPEGYAQETSINWLQEQGVIQGYPDGTFKPEASINRAEFLKMLYETTGMEEGETELSFPDVPSDAWYTPYIEAGYKDGVIQGYPDGTFKPANNINFAEAVKIVMKGFFNVDTMGVETSIACDHNYNIDSSAWFYKYIEKADELCLLEYDAMDPGAYITRAQMAELLYRAKAVYDTEHMGYYTPYSQVIVPLAISVQTVEEARFRMQIPPDWIVNDFNGKWWMYSSPDYSEVDADMQGNATVESGMKILVTVEENSTQVPEKIEGATNYSFTTQDTQSITSSYTAEDGQTQIIHDQILTPEKTFIVIRAYYNSADTEYNGIFSNIMRTFRYK